MDLDEHGHLHLHQSDIETFHTCPEQLRFTHLAHENGGRQETDAATVGTCLHHVIEHELETGFETRVRDLHGIAASVFLETLEGYKNTGATYVRSTFKDDMAAIKSLEILATSWFQSEEREHLRHVPESELLIEWEFDMPFCEVAGIQVWLAGRTDLILPGQNEIWDWKSASRPYQQWEKQRWAIQPTVYTWAAHQAGFLTPDNDGLFTFKNKVFVRGPKPTACQTIHVRRGPQNWAWLEKQIAHMVVLAGVLPDGPWPVNDHGALCGPKWCAFWSQCKGAFVSGETWV